MTADLVLHGIAIIWCWGWIGLSHGNFFTVFCHKENEGFSTEKYTCCWRSQQVTTTSIIQFNQSPLNSLLSILSPTSTTSSPLSTNKTMLLILIPPPNIFKLGSFFPKNFPSFGACYNCCLPKKHQKTAPTHTHTQSSIHPFFPSVSCHFLTPIHSHQKVTHTRTHTHLDP